MPGYETFLTIWPRRLRIAVGSAILIDYSLDIGVMHQLAGIQSVEKPSDLYSQAFEHFIAMELKLSFYSQFFFKVMNIHATFLKLWVLH